MFNFPAIFIANGTAVTLLIIILVSSKKPLRNAFLDEKMYYAMVILNIMQCLFETLGFLLDGKMAYGYHALLTALDTVLFINGIIFAYFWTIYADYKLFADMKRIKRKYPFIAIPAVLVIIGGLINLATPVFFVIDKYNTYQRTNLFIIPYIVTYFYLAYGVALFYSYRKEINKYLHMPAVLFLTPIIIASLLQFLFYGYSLMWLGVSIGLISLFINVQNESSYVDGLSGLFNRRYLERLLSIYSKKETASDITAGIMLDIDNFKSINDSFGHLVGDDAIHTVGKMLYAAVGDRGVICRYGGDEFIILTHIRSQNEITDMIDIIKTQASLLNESEEKPYKIGFSIGYSTYESKHESADDFLKKIDAFMYRDKKRKFDEKIIPDRRRN